MESNQDLLASALSNYDEYKKQLDSGNIKFKKQAGWQFIPVQDILPISYSRSDWNENTPGFWNHHGKTREDYNALAKQYFSLTYYIINGIPFHYVAKKHPELRPGIKLWFNKKDPVSLIQFKNSFFVVSGFHRAAALMQYPSAMVPSIVHEARLKNGI